jgi:hypothetical protein
MRGPAGYGPAMARSSEPGHHIEIFFNDADRIVDVDCENGDPGMASVVVDAIEHDDPDDAERILRDGVVGTVSRRS